MELLDYEDYIRALHRRRMSAGVLFHHADGRVLLVETTYKTEWEIPGGAVEAEESPWATAAREVHEELGWSRRLGGLLVINHVPASGAMPEGMAFIFDGGQIDDSDVAPIQSNDSEIRSAGLYTLHDAAQLVKTALHRTISVGMAALRGDGRPVLCDAGHPAAPTEET
ncbi:MULTISPECIES: NUDIX domain-containing protein [Actinoalloteichus]|uniref:NUDIX domain-containing protein n=1 Tax=Actinoalloteichus TaxID=65496 RepID=UPI000951E20A|nr:MULTISPECIES: NUDIX hydrolase [Actinoalloteichus]